MLAAHTAWLPLTRRVLVSVACETGGGTRAGKQRSKEAGKRQAGLGQSPQATLAAYNTTQRRGFACELFAAFFANGGLLPGLAGYKRTGSGGGRAAGRGQAGTWGRRPPGSCQVRGAGDVPMCVPPSNTDLISPRALHLGFIYVGACTQATVHRTKATVHRPQGRRYLRSGLNRPFLLCNVQWQWR